ncbi:MAG: DUF2628 domain-containing protein [Pseudomonadota bacterium]
MKTYTVHEPPPDDGEDGKQPTADDTAEDHMSARAEALRFVRDGKSVIAGLLAPFWLASKGLWLVLAGYIVVVCIAVVLTVVGIPAALTFVLVGALHVLVGLEADTLQRWSLARGGWLKLGVVTARNRLDAERRFFDAWLNEHQPSQRPDHHHVALTSST